MKRARRNTKNKKRNTLKKCIFGVGCSLFFVVMLLLYFSALWYIRRFGETGFDSVMFTLLSNMGGVNGDLLGSYVIEGVLPTVLVSALSIYVLFIMKINKEWFLKIRFKQKGIFSAVLALLFFFMAGSKVNIFGYIKKMLLTSTIYEDYFIEPEDGMITFPDKERNIIMIFLESMETTYMSKQDGGAFVKNVIPELTVLAEDNCNFSHNDGVGGFLTPSGTGWTVAGLVSQTSGVPLKGSSGALDFNEYGKEEFMPGVISLSDILKERGYKQTVVFGSDASYANRDVFYRGHNTDNIYDLKTAKEEGFIEEDYYVWWGMEDEYVYDYAKKKLSELSRGNEPFAFTMLTADTHFPDGYICTQCESKYNEQYNNVIACASHQVNSFIEWIKKQSFYKNTTVVVVGDHLSMDYQFIGRNVPESYERHVYNCFINSVLPEENCKGRVFTSLDIFPTVLAAMGCEIKGERLGLGTNLYSGKPTLAEELGYDNLEHQLLYSSNYYIKKLMIR